LLKRRYGLQCGCGRDADDYEAEETKSHGWKSSL
jgi:hypothetical protein